MYFSRLQRSAAGDAIASHVAASLGSSYRPEMLPRDGQLLLTSYFEDIQNALHPEFKDIRFAEFTRKRLNAYASKLDVGDPYIHIDQHLDRWLLLTFQILSIRAFIQLGEENRAASNTLMKTALEMAFDVDAFERLKDDSVHLFTDFADIFRFAYHLSIGALVFVCCHELAHHLNADVGTPQSQDREFAADRRGLNMAQKVFAARYPHQILRPTVFGLAGVYMLFSLWDMVERLLAQRDDLTARKKSASHPWAADRLDRLLPTLRNEPEICRFLDGYWPAIEDFRSDLGLNEIAQKTQPRQRLSFD